MPAHTLSDPVHPVVALAVPTRQRTNQCASGQHGRLWGSARTLGLLGPQPGEPNGFPRRSPCASALSSRSARSFTWPIGFSLLRSDVGQALVRSDREWSDRKVELRHALGVFPVPAPRLAVAARSLEGRYEAEMCLLVPGVVGKDAEVVAGRSVRVPGLD